MLILRVYPDVLQLTVQPDTADPTTSISDLTKFIQWPHLARLPRHCLEAKCGSQNTVELPNRRKAEVKILDHPLYTPTHLPVLPDLEAQD